MGPIEDEPPARLGPHLPVIGYWHIEQVYCTSCVPYDAASLPHVWEKIYGEVRPAHPIVCCRCGKVIAKTNSSAPGDEPSA